MKLIQAFKTTDGRIFENENEGKEYQATLLVTDEIGRLVNDELSHNSSNETVKAFILKNRQELFEILFQICEQ